MDSILNKPPYTQLKKFFELGISDEISCCGSACSKTVNTTLRRSNYLGIASSISPKPPNVQYLFEDSCRTNVLSSTCDLCNSPKQTCQKVAETSDLLVIQVTPATLNNDGITKLPTKIKEIPNKI